MVLLAAVMAVLLTLGLLDTQQPRGLFLVPRPVFSIQLAAGKLPSTDPLLSGGQSPDGSVLLGEATVLPAGDPGVAVRVVSSSVSVGLHRFTPSSALGMCTRLRAAYHSVT